jgi:glycosyltransferase involved in cell wall biosynthesis
MRAISHLVRCDGVRVGISLLTLASGELGGSAVAARQLVRALAAAGTHDYVVFVPADAKDAAGPLPAVAVHEPPAERRWPLHLGARALDAFRSRRVHTKLDDVDALHYALASPEPETEAPTVVTLHDVQHRDLPDFFGAGRRSFQRDAYDRAARSAEAIVVPSEFVRERVRDLLELDVTRVHVIPPGLNQTVFRPGEDTREPFILYPARPWPHKNHARLFEAFATLRKTRPKLRLILTGEGLDRLGHLPDGVERWGVVAPADLASLYRRAACLVYPSLYEGLGLPPLEAMACGCPVAAANVAALPETVGEAAVLFDPLDPDAMAEAILETDERRAELRELGLARAAGFTWAEAARRHEDLYRSLGARPESADPSTTIAAS